MSSNFFSRGSISSENTQFHMVGVIPLGTPVADLPGFLGGIDTTEDTYFMLCANHFKDGLGNEKQRVFWSCDPTDFIINFNGNSLNQGVVNLILNSKKGSDSYSFKFLTSKKNSIYSLNQYFDNNLTTNPIDIEMNNKSPAKFQISQDRYNLRTDQIYVSIPYELTEYQELYSTNADEKFKWCFRKFYSEDQSVVNNLILKGNSNYSSTSLFTYTESLRPFQETNVPEINFTSTNIYSITLDTNNKYFSIPKTDTNGWGTTSNLFDLIATSNGIITFVENSVPANKYTFKFHSRNTDSDGNMLFHYYSLPDTFFGTTNFFTSGLTKICTIKYEIRNDPYGFDSIQNSSLKKVSDWFQIYFIPSYDSAIFPGNYSLKQTEIYPINNLIPLSFSNLKIYNPNNGQDTNNPNNENNNFKQYFYREFSTFFILKAILGPINSFWTTESEAGYPNIAINPATNNDTQSSIFTWTRHVEAYHDFMYNYCENFESCGYCFGNGIKSQTCIPHDSSKKSAINSSFGNDEPVFLSAPKDDNSIDYPNKNNQEYLGLIILIIIFGIIMLAIISTIIYFNSKSYYPEKKKFNTYNPVFDNGA